MFANIGKSLKGLIMEEESASEPAKVSTPAIQKGVPTLRVDNQYTEALRALIKARPTALTALITAAEKLESVIPDSTMRLKAAFQMVKSEGRGIKELLDAITVHAADLESQRLQYSRAMDAELQTAVGKLEVDATNLEANTSAAQQQIKNLQTQLEQMTAMVASNGVKATEIARQIESEKIRLAQNSQQFDTALAVVKNELENQRTVIQSALS